MFYVILYTQCAEFIDDKMKPNTTAMTEFLESSRLDYVFQPGVRVETFKACKKQEVKTNLRNFLEPLACKKNSNKVSEIYEYVCIVEM